MVTYNQTPLFNTLLTRSTVRSFSNRLSNKNPAVHTADWGWSPIGQFATALWAEPLRRASPYVGDGAAVVGGRIFDRSDRPAPRPLPTGVLPVFGRRGRRTTRPRGRRRCGQAWACKSG